MLLILVITLSMNNLRLAPSMNKMLKVLCLDDDCEDTARCYANSLDDEDDDDDDDDDV